MKEVRLDCPYDFTSRCTIGECDCKPKQETLEEFINSQPYYGSCTTEYLEGIEVGAKWQQKSSYNEEELKSILQFFVKDTRGDKPWVDADDEWFKQFKKSSDGNK